MRRKTGGDQDLMTRPSWAGAMATALRGHAAPPTMPTQGGTQRPPIEPGNWTKSTAAASVVSAACRAAPAGRRPAGPARLAGPTGPVWRTAGPNVYLAGRDSTDFRTWSGSREVAASQWAGRRAPYNTAAVSRIVRDRPPREADA
jgi:hypothetical protein